MYKLPSLSYSLDALEPFISRSIMELHYTKHHSTYVDKLNAAVKSANLETDDLEYLLSNLDSLPDDIRQSIRNNGGGHYNHSLFWKMMTNNATEISSDAVLFFNNHFGSLDEFKQIFANEALGVFGSGWVWLLSSGEITSTANQDSPAMEGRSDIVLALDVWEHAYYLDYKNDRKEYISKWWNVVDWDYVSNKVSA